MQGGIGDADFGSARRVIAHFGISCGAGLCARRLARLFRAAEAENQVG